MLPRWLTALGFVGLCTSFACFPPISVPIGQTRQPTGATPWPSGYSPPQPSYAYGSPSPTPTGPPSPGARPAAGIAASAYFPLRAGTWRYRVTTTPAGGQPIAGERTLALADVVTSGDTATATATSTVKLNVPGFTALDEAAVRSQLSRTADRFALVTAGRTTAIMLTAAAGETWTENGLAAKLATWADRVTVGGKAYEDVLRVEYADPAAPSKPVATAWFAPDVGLLQRLDAFTHDGKAWEARAELTDHPSK